MSWIKMRAELITDPSVMRICRLTGMDKYAVLGRLFCFWTWVDVNSLDGKVSFATVEDVSNVVGDEHFVDALVKVKWLLRMKNRIEVPNFSRHNGESAKKRMLANQRQAKLRASRKSNAPSVTNASTREEKRREENKPLVVVTPTVKPDPVDKSKPDGNKLPETSKPQNGAWWRTDEGIEAKALEIGIPGRPGESYQQLKARIFDAIAERERNTA